MDLTPNNQNQEGQALTEWKPSKIGNSTANIILNAQALEPIRFRSEEELKQVLRYAMVLVGLRGNNMPTDEEKFVLLNFIKSNFGNQTPEEIKLAFEYAIAGKFDVDVKCYENFSCEYFARIMKAYIAFEREEMRSVKKVFHFEVDKPTEEALKRQAIEIANNYADQIEKSKEEGKEYQWYTAGLASLYDYLEQFKIHCLNNEERWIIWNSLSKISDDAIRKNECRKVAYINFINSLVDFDARLDDNGNIKPKQ